jgi:hypothetical protein
MHTIRRAGRGFLIRMVVCATEHVDIGGENVIRHRAPRPAMVTEMSLEWVMVCPFAMTRQHAELQEAGSPSGTVSLLSRRAEAALRAVMAARTLAS